MAYYLNFAQMQIANTLDLLL